MNLNTPLTEIVKNHIRTNGLKQLGINTILDLLEYYPRKIIPPAIFISSLSSDELYEKSVKNSQKFIIQSTIKSLMIIPPRGKFGVSRLLIKMLDSKGTSVEAVYFGKSLKYLQWIQSKYKSDDKVALIGIPSNTPQRQNTRFRTIEFKYPEIVVYSPVDLDFKRQEAINFQSALDLFSKPRTVYAATKKLGSDKIYETIQHILELISTDQNLSNDPRIQIWKSIHFPVTLSEFEEAKYRIKFNEALVFQIVLQFRQKEIANSKGVARIKSATDNCLVHQFIDSLPFELTKSQVRVISEISNELFSEIPMQRLLQGDVGSGKTVVALIAMLQVIDAGGQCAILVPTSVLANQHYEVIKSLLGNLYTTTNTPDQKNKIRIALVTGSLNQSEKKEVWEHIESGEINIVVGTHSLLHHHDRFRDLGLVVVDEQHRFGVEQRNRLREQSERVPHLLAMTATPIPRSVAMTVFGDLEISTLQDTPKNRGEIRTFIVQNSDKILVDRMWARIREEINVGRNAFIVAPRINEDDFTFRTQNNDCVKSENAEVFTGQTDNGTPSIAIKLFEKLTQNGLEEPLSKKGQSIRRLQNELDQMKVLNGVKIGVMHGELSTKEKHNVMEGFIDRKTPILLSTTVIEVGIDVPNASIMVITDADKFGLATLHQLRGRIGRGRFPSICFLLTSQGSITDQGMERIKTIEKTLDGFLIAKNDVKIRGEGDIISRIQSGKHSSFKLLKVLDDQDIIEEAHKQAVEIVRTDPDLVDHQFLKQVIEQDLDQDKKDYIRRS
jgi:ATP-dependent DNA helicase RecG